MPYQKYPQFSRNGLASPSHDTLSAHPRGGVGQEKRGLTSARTKQEQPARSAPPPRADRVNTPVTRAENLLSDDAPLQQLTLHVKPRVKRRLLELADGTGASLSKTGSTILERAVQQHVDMEYGELLKPAFEALVDKRLTKGDDRLASLLIHNLLSSERTLIITTQLLNLTPGLTPEVVAQILDKASTDARRKIARRNPQLEAIIKELKEILAANEDKKEKKA